MQANTQSSIGVGIDTARYAHHVSFLDEQKRTALKPFHFTENAQGYRLFEHSLQKLKLKHPDVHFRIHIDAAGQYAENLLQRLHALDLPTTISVGQPARNKAYRQVHFDKRKADPAESLVCARFAIVERPEPTPTNPPEFRQLRDIVAEFEAASKHKTRLVISSAPTAWETCWPAIASRWSCSKPAAPPPWAARWSFARSPRG